MSYIYLAYSGDDADEVGPIATMLHQAGWDLMFGPSIDPNADREDIDRRLNDAACVLVVWSGNSIGSKKVNAEAQAGFTANKLVAVRLDDAAHPRPEVSALELMITRTGPADPGASELKQRLIALGGEPRPRSEESQSRAWSRAPAGKPRKRNTLVFAGAAAVVALAVVGGGALLFMRNGGSGIPEARAEPAAAPAKANESIDVARRWSAVPQGDPTAIRGFLKDVSSGPFADQATIALNRLDDASWAEIAGAPDAILTLKRVETYRLDFPAGRHAEDAIVREGQERNRIAEAQIRLDALGFSVGQTDGVVTPATIAAIESFEAAQGKAPTGAVDDTLLAALRARRTGPIPALPPAAPLKPAVAAPPATSPVRTETATPPATLPITPPSNTHVATPLPSPQTAPQPPVSIPPSATAVAEASTPPSIPQPTTAAPFKDCYLCPEMAGLPRGSFRMGDLTGAGEPDEKPVRTVQLAYRVAIGRREVTFEEWDACVSDGGCKYSPDDMGWGRSKRPVINIGFVDVKQYLDWLSKKSGKTYRLPSEAEWEYAARAGSEADYSFGDRVSNLCAYANHADGITTYAWRNTTCKDGIGPKTAPVATYSPNAFGLFDMHGNVWEWTADCWHDSYAGAPSDGSAWTNGCSKADHVLRGGAFSVDAGKLRSAYRYSFASERFPFFGFRVARAMDQ